MEDDFVSVFRVRDPAGAGVDTAAAIRRMKEARSRAVKGGGVKEVKTLAALQQELKVSFTKVSLARRQTYAEYYGIHG